MSPRKNNRNMKVLIVLLVIGIFEHALSSSEGGSTEKEKGPARTSKGFYINSKVTDNRNLFSPRMDYDEWTPLGRGDPLKNDPTYDYVPPVLERVHYWMDPSKRTPDPPVLNSGVLILGSSRTEPTFTLRPTTTKYPVGAVKEAQADSRLDTMSLLDPFLKLVDMSKLGINLNPSTNGNYHKATTSSNRIHPQNYQRPIHNQQYTSHRHHPPQALQRPPYTMLMPPPPPSSTSSPVMTFATVITTTETPKPQTYREATSAVAQTATTAAGTAATATSTTPVATKTNSDSNITTIYPTTMLANTENVYRPVAIAMPEENETIRNDANERNAQMEKSEPKRGSEADAEDETAVLPMLSSSGKNKKNAEERYASNHEHNNNFQAGKHPPMILHREYEKPLTELQSNSGNIYKSKEPYKYRPLYDSVDAPNVQDNNLKLASQVKTQPPRVVNAGEKFQSAYKWPSDRVTTRPVTTTRVTSTLTTDPMFKHYKQPSEPIRGPFYLIIQGHSKVKTYGASKNPINGLLTSNEIKDAEDRKDRYGEPHDLEAQETRRRKSKSPKWRWSEANPRKEKEEEEDEDEKYGKFIDSFPDGNDITPPSMPEHEQMRNLENFEDAFGKSEGGGSKKRYLMYDALNETYVRPERSARGGRQLLKDGDGEATAVPWPATMITVTNRPTVSADSKEENKSHENEENLDIESFIALNDDYAPEDVVSLLLKEEGQGSGLGNFVASVFGKSLKDSENK